MRDPILKKIFSEPEMIELLVRRYRPGLAPEVDFSTLGELPNELLSDQLDKRIPDMLFIADARGGTRKVLFHIEFQAASDPAMPLRNLLYAGLAAQKLRGRYRDLRAPGALRAVSMVLYHGTDPWSAPVSVEELVPGITELELVRAEAVDPGGVHAEDIPAIVLGLVVPGQRDIDVWRRLDALKRALEPRARRRLREHIARNLRHLLRSVYDHPVLREASPMATMLEVFTEARRQGEARARREGRLEGRQEGRQEGRLEGEALMIERITARRFGPETARRISRLLADVTDPDQMDRVAEAVVDCADRREFLDRAGAVLQAGKS